MKKVNLFIILSCLFANAQANDPDPIAAPQEAPTQKWESVLGTRYPIIEERGSPYWLADGLEKDTKEIILPTLEAINTAPSYRVSLEKYLINLAVYFFNYSNPLIHIMNAAMEEKTRQLFEENEDWRYYAAWPRIVGVFVQTHGRRSEAYENFPAGCPDFKSFLNYVAPGQAFPPDSWIREGLGSYYKETIKKIPYVLAAVGEIYTKKDDLPLLGESIDRIYKEIKRVDGLTPEERSENALHNWIKYCANKLSDNLEKNVYADLLEALRAVAALKNQPKLLEKKLDSIKELVPTSAAFIDSVKEKIKPINFEKVYFTENSIDNILTADGQILGIDWRGETGLSDGTAMEIGRYLRSRGSLNFAIKQDDVRPSGERPSFRHSPETKNWEIRIMESKQVQEEADGEVKTTRVWVPKIHAITPKDQDFIVRALVEKKVLTPLINDRLIADQRTDPEKEAAAPVDFSDKTYEEKKNALKAALKKKQEEKKKQKKNDSEEE